ncbi:hypothetical protein F5Y17DRAFT_254452 [Xylariaceae sp. FL0594]|nr:hypothetical protein F5Y17DRAFT_254452 [Xylariaceae sp. FL0594]
MAWPISLRSPQYEYSSLQSAARTFRVIRFLPSTRSFYPLLRETLNVEILELNVDDHVGTYDTLSYCWGPNIADRDVNIWLPPCSPNVNGSRDAAPQCRRLRISASLEAALLSLARESEAGISRPIFADQICINQADPDEKIQQVRLMGEIYSRSARAIVWLGPQTQETRRYYEFSTELSREAVLCRVMGPHRSHVVQVLDAVVDQSIPLETEVEIKDRDDLLDLVTRYGPRIPLRGMAEVLRRAWMGRLWTVQEGCLPPELTFRCGELSLCFDCFRGILLFYAVCTRYWARYNTASVSRDEVRTREKMFDLTKPFHRILIERRAIHNDIHSKVPTVRKRSPLYDLVLRYNVNDVTPKLGATKAEDRIYSLLGLAAADDEVMRETVEGMEVDNVAGTYTKFAASVVKRNVDVLLFAQSRGKPTAGYRLPSWVPDWSVDPLRTPHGYTNPTTPLFSAGGQQSSDDVDVDASTGTLQLKAIHVGRVTNVGTRGITSDPTSVTDNLDYISAHLFFQEVEEFLKSASRVSLHASNPTDSGGFLPQEQQADKISNSEDDKAQHLLECTTACISDGGLSTKEFLANHSLSTAQSKLHSVYKKISVYGGNLLRIETNTRTMSTFSGMIRSTASSLPWYFTPLSAINILRRCAVDPISAFKTFATGFVLALADVAQVLWYSAKVRLYASWSRARRMRRKMNLQNADSDESVLMRVGGISMADVRSEEWNEYTANLLRNAGRRVFATDNGFVGLGPESLGVGDVVVVAKGGSTPLALRCCDSVNSGVGLRWRYVGEVYCDGVMDGEMLSAPEGREVTRYEII